MFIQSFEQSNLKRLNRMTRGCGSSSSIDANDVSARRARSIYQQPPIDRPYDWTVSGDPEPC